MENYIQSPLNYTGGKYKLLKQIVPLFPTNIDIFVDLLGGYMSDTIKHIQEFINKLGNQKIEINKEVIKLDSYKDFEVNQEYKNILNLEYSQLCSEILELQKKITRVRHKLDMYTDGLCKYERYKLLKETLENIENNIELFEEVLKHEKERIKNTGI